MFETAIPGAGYGYGAQQIGPQGFYGNPQGFHGIFGQAGNPVQSQQFSPYNVMPGGQSFGYPAGQSVLPLTIGPGTIPFQLTQQQLGPSQFGFSQPQLQQPQVQVVPFTTPQGWVGQLYFVNGQPVGVGMGGGIGLGGGVGAPQLAAAPWSMGPYGYGIPQFGPQGQLGGFGGGYSPLQAQQQIPQPVPQVAAAPWSMGSYGYGVPPFVPQGQLGGFGGGYSPLQAQQQIPQPLPQAYLPLVPFGATPFSGQLVATTPIH